MRRRATKPGGGPATAIASPQRLQRYLAAAGLGSRRQCEELILAGRVEVDGKVVDTLGSKVDPNQQAVSVDGVRVRPPKRLYYMVYKPPGVVSTLRDPAGRQRVVDLVPQTKGRVYNVGRLDKSSEGLILLTNDGDLADRLTHPRYGVEKTYRVQVAGHPDRQDLARLRRGVHLAEGFARVVRAKIVSRYKESTVLEIVLNEGRNREIRRLLARLGHKVLRLKRVAIDGVKLGQMAPGEWRPLRRDEVRLLYDAAKPQPTSQANRRRRPAPVEPARAARTRKQKPPGRRPKRR